MEGECRQQEEVAGKGEQAGKWGKGGVGSVGVFHGQAMGRVVLGRVDPNSEPWTALHAGINVSYSYQSVVFLFRDE